MATTTRKSTGSELRGLRAKAALFDELVEQLARAEDEAERLRVENERLGDELQVVREQAPTDGVDAAWREIANELAGALRPYSMFREQTVEDDRIVVHTRVPGSTLHAAHRALDRLARQVAIESYREHGFAVAEDGDPLEAPRAPRGCVDRTG